jgi:hypothetical protein
VMPLSKSQKFVKISPVDFLSDTNQLDVLSGGEHGCIFYTKKEDIEDIFFSHIKHALDDGWAAVYLTAIESPTNIQGLMKCKYGIGVEKYDADESFLVLMGKDLYEDPQGPNLERWKTSIQRCCEKFISTDKMNKKGVRIAANLSSYFLSRDLVNQWYDLEYSVNKSFYPLPITALCAYQVSPDDLALEYVGDKSFASYCQRVSKEYSEFIDAHSFVIYIQDINEGMMFTL